MSPPGFHQLPRRRVVRIEADLLLLECGHRVPPTRHGLQVGTRSCEECERLGLGRRVLPIEPRIVERLRVAKESER